MNFTGAVSSLYVYGLIRRKVLIRVNTVYRLRILEIFRFEDRDDFGNEI